MRFATLADWLAWQETLHSQAIDLGLARVSQVFERMESGGRHPFTITVGGTNGKGSSVAMLDAILRGAGYRVGTYTSPHLLRYNERIRIDGQPVEDARLCEAFERVDAARGDISLSFFEFGTLAALDIFSRENLDMQVLEVGLGGRLDAVNIIDADAALVASIDIDHREWLGDTRDAIGLEKAGIFRPGRPAVIGDPSPPDSVIRFAAEQNIPLLRSGSDFGYAATAEGWTWYNPDARFEGLPFPAIPGEHQLMNASAVLAVLSLIHDQRPVSEAAIRVGLGAVNLAGRFQFFQGQPSEAPVLLDVAHNPQAVGVLAGHLRRQFAGRRIHAVFAVMRDKDIAGILDNIHDLVDAWYLAPLQMTRAAPAEQLREILAQRGITSVEHGFPDVPAAFASARRHTQENDLILVFGSFFLVSEYLAHAA
ncbi:bifunctional tetrahydrofolate synthase/dihydrofolate synthase [Methylomagnum sp.]